MMLEKYRKIPSENCSLTRSKVNFAKLNRGNLLFSLKVILKGIPKTVIFMHKMAICCFQVLASGMNLHLCENELIRGIFGLGAPLPSLSQMQSSRPSKHERVRKNLLSPLLQSRLEFLPFFMKLDEIL